MDEALIALSTLIGMFSSIIFIGLIIYGLIKITTPNSKKSTPVSSSSNIPATPKND